MTTDNPTQQKLELRRTVLPNSRAYDRAGTGDHSLFSNKHCCVCGRPCKGRTAWLLLTRAIDGTQEFAISSPEDATEEERNTSMWIAPIGADCLGKHPALAHAVIHFDSRASVVAPQGDAGISWTALLGVLERLRSKNRNPNNQWYHGWNAAIRCLINDINARVPSPASSPVPPEQDRTRCEHGVLWSMDCIACPPPEYVAVTPAITTTCPARTIDLGHDFRFNGQRGGMFCHACDQPQPAATPAPVVEPWRDEGGHAWEIRKNVTCVECPHCCFVFAAEHTSQRFEADQWEGYDCPNCEGCPEAAEEIATLPIEDLERDHFRDHPLEED